MTLDGTNVLVAVITALGGALVAWLALRQSRASARVTTTTDLINQLQDERDKAHERFSEEIASMRDEHERQMNAIKAEHEHQRTELLAIVAEARKDRRLLFDYIEVLRRHISEGKPPPPQPWPEGLSY